LALALNWILRFISLIAVFKCHHHVPEIRAILTKERNVTKISMFLPILSYLIPSCLHHLLWPKRLVTTLHRLWLLHCMGRVGLGQD